MKDWTGNKKSNFVTLGASAHSEEEREKHDYYATEPKATWMLLDMEDFCDKIWEPACGGGHMSEIIRKEKYDVFSTDLIDRNYSGMSAICDFLKTDIEWDGDIITNPPYKYSQEFAEKALAILKPGRKLALFMPITFFEGKKRREFLKKNPIKRAWVSSSRLLCAKGGDFEKYSKGSARCYCWFIWEKGWSGDTTIKTFN